MDRSGEFFANNTAGIIPLGCDRESGELVRQNLATEVDRRDYYSCTVCIYHLRPVSQCNRLLKYSFAAISPSCAAQRNRLRFRYQYAPRWSVAHLKSPGVCFSVLCPSFRVWENYRNPKLPCVLFVSCVFHARPGTQVSRFKGFVIGGGGLLESRHWPLDCEAFVEGLGDDVPVAIFGVGARCVRGFWVQYVLQQYTFYTLVLVFTFILCTILWSVDFFPLFPYGMFHGRYFHSYTLAVVTFYRHNPYSFCITEVVVFDRRHLK